MKVKLFLVAIALATVGFVSAQNAQSTKGKGTHKACYVDANKNGVCDKHENGTCKVEKGKGTHKACYVDANKNGVCDKHENGTCKVEKGKGTQNGKCCGKEVRDGSGRGKGQGQCKGQGLRDGSGKANGGKGSNYVDKNKNGVCDRRENQKK